MIIEGYEGYMPELPEVETVRRGLAPSMEGAVIRHVELRRPDLRFAFPPDFAARLTNRRILGLSRRAKYLIAGLDDGASLLMHLGMSGSFRVIRQPGSQMPGDFHHELIFADVDDPSTKDVGQFLDLATVGMGLRSDFD